MLGSNPGMLGSNPGMLGSNPEKNWDRTQECWDRRNIYMSITIGRGKVFSLKCYKNTDLNNLNWRKLLDLCYCLFYFVLLDLCDCLFNLVLFDLCDCLFNFVLISERWAGCASGCGGLLEKEQRRSEHRWPVRHCIWTKDGPRRYCLFLDVMPS